MTASPWRKYRRSTYFRVVFPTLPSLTVEPSEIDLYQERFSHDILELTFLRDSSTWASLLKTGTPVIFTVIQGTKGSRKQTWTGYVSQVNNQNAAQLERIMKVVCVGASYVLKTRANRTWRNKSVTDVARIIAKEFGLAFEGDISTRRFEQLSITGQSYWNWLQEYAAKIGYALYVQNTTLYMKKITNLLNSSISNAAVFGLSNPYPPANSEAFDRTLDSFTASKGDYFDSSENKYSVKVTTGVNPLTGKVITKSATPLGKKGQGTRATVKGPLFNDYSDEVVHSSSFAKRTAEDLALGAEFGFPAKARGQGDPRVAPYKAVYILGTGSDTDGYWVVNKVHHTMNITGLYEVEMDLVTDGIGQNTQSPFRKTPSSLQGTIDLDYLVAESLRGPARTGSESQLSLSVPRIRETDQGFNIDPKIWRAN